MPQVPWDKEVEDADFGRAGPGKYLAKVKECVEKNNRSGIPMFSYTLHSVPDDKKLCYDNAMLDGKGWGIGRAKLSALGFTESNTFLNAADMNGKLVFVECKTRTYVTKSGEEREGLEVDIYAPGSKCGYWPLSDPPTPELGKKLNGVATDDEPHAEPDDGLAF